MRKTRRRKRGRRTRRTRRRRRTRTRTRRRPVARNGHSSTSRSLTGSRRVQGIERPQ